MVDCVRVFGVGLGQFAREDLRLLLEPSLPQGLDPRAFRRRGCARSNAWSSGTWFATCDHGLKLAAGGVPLTKAVLIGDATRSN